MLVLLFPVVNFNFPEKQYLNAVGNAKYYGMFYFTLKIYNMWPEPKYVNRFEQVLTKTVILAGVWNMPRISVSKNLTRLARLVPVPYYS